MTYSAGVKDDKSRKLAAHVQALMATSKVLTAVVSRSLNAAGSAVTIPQLRILVMLSSQGPLNLTAVAQALGVNASNASRTCDQLVTGGLVLRSADTEDRRNIVLRLSISGTALVEQLMSYREAVLGEIAEGMKPKERVALASGLGAFLRAAEALSADEAPEDDEDHPLRWLT